MSIRASLGVGAVHWICNLQFVQGSVAVPGKAAHNRLTIYVVGVACHSPGRVVFETIRIPRAIGHLRERTHGWVGSDGCIGDTADRMKPVTVLFSIAYDIKTGGVAGSLLACKLSERQITQPGRTGSAGDDARATLHDNEHSGRIIRLYRYNEFKVNKVRSVDSQKTCTLQVLFEV